MVFGVKIAFFQTCLDCLLLCPAILGVIIMIIITTPALGDFIFGLKRIIWA